MATTILVARPRNPIDDISTVPNCLQGESAATADVSFSAGSHATWTRAPMRWSPWLDATWWSTEQFEGHPLYEALRRRDIAVAFRYLKTRGWSGAVIVASTGHGAMQRHIPDEHDPRSCACGDEFPCGRREVARELLVDAGHLILDTRARRSGR